MDDIFLVGGLGCGVFDFCVEHEDQPAVEDRHAQIQDPFRCGQVQEPGLLFRGDRDRDVGAGGWVIAFLQLFPVQQGCVDVFDSVQLGLVTEGFKSFCQGFQNTSSMDRHALVLRAVDVEIGIGGHDGRFQKGVLKKVSMEGGVKMSTHTSSVSTQILANVSAAASTSSVSSNSP